MQRYFVSKLEIENKEIISSDVYHITTVMRMKQNDEIILINNYNEYLVKIINISKNKITFEILNEKKHHKKSKKITLIQGLPKKDKFEFIIQKACELGVSNIIGVKTRYSDIKIKDEKYNTKIDRYNKILKEASEQSNRIDIPNIELKNSLNEIDYSNYDLKILCYEKEKEKMLYDVKDINKYNNICIIIGPEGGISNEEYEFLLKNNFISILLGKNILRTETASISVLSILLYEWSKK